MQIAKHAGEANRPTAGSDTLRGDADEVSGGEIVVIEQLLAEKNPVNALEKPGYVMHLHMTRFSEFNTK